MQYSDVIFALMAVVLLVGCPENSAAPSSEDREVPRKNQPEGRSMIAKEQLDEMFARIRADTDWDMDSDMLWGYFFTDEDRGKLEVVAEKLAGDGYRVVEIRSDEEAPFFWLHVEKVEAHSPETLHQRNQQFYQLAAEHGLDSYDGMDVGLVSEEGEAGP